MHELMDGLTRELAVWEALVLLALSFYLLWKSASWLVDGAVGIAERFGVPKLLIGIVLVGFATTAPEFAVSILSAISGNPEMALGNAVGSVIVDDGVALALVGILAVAPVMCSRRVLRTAAVFLIVIDVAAFVLIITNRAGDKFVLTRSGGAVLLTLFFVYLGYIIWDRKKHPGAEDERKGASSELLEKGSVGPREAGEKPAERGLAALLGLFLLGLVIVVGASEVVVVSAKRLAVAARVPPAVVALTVVAIGTSVPEIATCVAAARKGHGALAIGDIIGADILNIAWIAGASAVANPLAVDTKVIYFMFPSMLAIVGVTLAGLLWKNRMTKKLGITLIVMYCVYMGLMVWLFPPQLGAAS